MLTHRLRVLLFGLDPALADELKSTLSLHEVAESKAASSSACAREIDEKSPDVVFCGSDRRCRETALRAVSVSRPWTPVIVASPQPETADWLDALESGAADYCSAPFESHQISWILDSTIKAARRVAAVA
jgi:DNA-binding NtrC family response regulator